jgi:hypothetical protein
VGPRGDRSSHRVALSVTGLALRRWWYLAVLFGFLAELVLVGISGLGLDPCGLS